MLRKKAVLQSLSVPESVALYIFGSFLYIVKPNDIDLIIIYDNKIYPGSSIFKACQEILAGIKERVHSPIHVTYLSYEEERTIKFVEEVGAQLIATSSLPYNH